MNNSSKCISDDFSDAGGAIPQSSPDLPSDTNEPVDSNTNYAPTSDKKPNEHPDPLQRRVWPSASTQSLTSDDGERLFSARTSQRLH